MANILGELVIEELRRKDREEFSKFEPTCKDHYGKICVNNDGRGILCNYLNCPYRALKGKERKSCV